MEMLLAAPVIIKVLASLALILVLTRVSKNLMVSAAVGAVLLGAWCGHPALKILEISWKSFSSADNLMLMLVVIEVISLSRQMSEAGVTKDLVAAVQSRVSRRASLATLPAVIGLLPMPGGAAFSAPLVDDVDSDSNLDPMLKTRINYWFRHIWEYWWPLYPGVLLALAITKLDLWQLILLHLPLSVSSVAVGYLCFLRKVEQPGRDAAAAGAYGGRRILGLVAPILVVIVTYALLRLFLPQVPRANRYLPMVIGIFLSMLVLQYQRPLDAKAWKRIVLSRKSFMLAALVAVVMIYGAFVGTELPDGTPLVDQMGLELDKFGVPIMAVIMIIPFISGMATGLAIGFVGASFPIVIRLAGGDANLGMVLSTTVLAFGFGYVGMLLSPVHICLIVTNEHFKTHLMDSIFKLLKPAAIMLVIVILYHLLNRWIFAV